MDECDSDYQKKRCLMEMLPTFWNTPFEGGAFQIVAKKTDKIMTKRRIFGIGRKPLR
jgi:hypothetical protein